jgi:hypothetical protein
VVSTNTSLNTTSQPTAVYVYATDANGTSHETTENVRVTIGSSATGVASLDSLAIQIDSGQYYSANHLAQWAPGVAGTAQLTATDARSAYYRYFAGSANVTVNTPTPYMSFNGLTLGLGQYSDEYISLPDYRTTALTIPLGHAAVPRTNTPASVTIPVNNYYQYFRIAGTSVGSDTISIAPTGHNPAKGTVIVSSGRIDPISGWPTSVKAGDSVQVTIYARDINQTVHYVTAATTYTLTPNANVKFVSGGANSATITSVTIPADQTQVSFWIKGVTAGNASSVFTSTGYTTYTGFLTVLP